MKETAGVESSEQLQRLQEVAKEAAMLKKKLSHRGATAQEVADLRERLADTEEKLASSDARRRKLHNKLQELRGNVRVLARIRPAFKADEDAEISGFAMESGIEGTSVAIALPPQRGSTRARTSSSSTSLALIGYLTRTQRRWTYSTRCPILCRALSTAFTSASLATAKRGQARHTR